MTRRHMTRHGVRAFILAVLLAGLALPTPAAGVAAAPPLPSCTASGAGRTAPRCLITLPAAISRVTQTTTTGGAGRAAPIRAANTMHVTSCADSGTTTLRGRIASAAGDTIVFDQDCVITLTSDVLLLTTNVTIDGTGHTVIVDGNHAFTPFGVNGGVTASLIALMIRNGVSIEECFGLGCGGGVVSAGTLSVTNCTLSGNAANYGGAIASIGGTLSVTNSTFTGNSAIYDTFSHSGGYGGGIYSVFPLTVTTSSFTGNSAFYGGAIAGSTATVTASTFAGNSVTGDGGAIASAGTLTVANSTLTSNSAVAANGINGFGGGIYTVAPLTVTNSTITGNSAQIGGGIDNDDTAGGTTTAANTIIAGNTVAGTGPDLSGTIHSGGYNLFGTIRGATLVNAHNDIFNQHPGLGPLGNYGGPTQTIPLLQGSPAIYAGSDAVCAAAPVSGVDQRGYSRPVGPHCDIGAFETGMPNALPGVKPPAPAGSPPNALPATRPPGTTAAPAPNPLPAPRP